MCLQPAGDQLLNDQLCCVVFILSYLVLSFVQANMVLRNNGEEFMLSIDVWCQGNSLLREDRMEYVIFIHSFQCRLTFEIALKLRGGPSLVFAHSMGNNVFRYFVEWLKLEIAPKHYIKWLDEHIHAYFAVGMSTRRNINLLYHTIHYFVHLSSTFPVLCFQVLLFSALLKQLELLFLEQPLVFQSVRSVILRNLVSFYCNNLLIHHH